MISGQRLILAVQTFWSSSSLITAPTIYPGTTRDTSRLPAWYELWVDAWDQPVQRAIAPDQLDLMITLHCFAQRRDALLTVVQLADVARQTLTGQMIDVPAGTGESDSCPGAIVVQEHRVRDLTRVQQEAGVPHLRHLVVTWSGRAHCQS